MNRGGRCMNGIMTAALPRLSALEAEVSELQRPAVFGDYALYVFGDALRNVRLYLQRDLHVRPNDRRQVLHDLLADLPRTPAEPDRVDLDHAVEAARKGNGRLGGHKRSAGVSAS